MAKRTWGDWSFPDGHSDGRPTTYTTQSNDGYELGLTLQENEVGELVCSGLNIQFTNKEKKELPAPINSRFFQLLGLGELLSSAREHYEGWGEILDEVYTEMDIERELKDWTPLGPQGFPDEKYAAVAYMYVKFVREGLESPIAALAGYWGDVDKNTVSSRVMEARARGLLTTPKAGTYGGKLTAKAEKLLPQKKTKGKGKK